MSPRVYDNSLRVEQAEQTRLRIVDALLAIAADDGDVSTAAIAARAGVSEPTIYRHFHNREALIAAANEHTMTRLGSGPVPEHADDLSAAAFGMGVFMGRNAAFFRAGVHNPGLRELRLHGRRKRLADHRRLMAPSLAHLAPREREIAFAALASTLRADTWDYLTSAHQLSDEEAGRAMAFIVEACVGALAGQARAKTRTLVEDRVVRRGHEIDRGAGTPKAAQPARSRARRGRKGREG